MKILAIDPGKRSIAWAYFDDLLVAAGYEQHKAEPFEVGTRDMLLRVAREVPDNPDIVVVEVPRIYPKSRQRPNDLIDLALTAGACAVFGPVYFVHPRTWKGQVPKEIHHARQVFAPEEVNVLKRWAKNHHVLDAAALGKWYRSRSDG